MLVGTGSAAYHARQQPPIYLSTVTLLPNTDGNQITTVTIIEPAQLPMGPIGTKNL